MRSLHVFLALALAFVFGLASEVRAQAVTIQSPEQLQKLVAPIALYDDQLLACVLTAATLPAELSQASTWLAANPGPLTQMPAQDWDPAVKALLSFPTILTRMTTNASATRKLGQAVLAQQADVLAAVQAYRSMLVKSGAYQASAYQAVTAAGDAVVVMPATAGTVYVPAYDTDEYDYYRPALTWGAGVAVGDWWGYRNFNWPAGAIVASPDRIAAYHYGPGSPYAALGQSTVTVWTPSATARSSYASYRAATGPSGSGTTAGAPPSGTQGSANDWSSSWDNTGTATYGPGYDYGYGYGYGAVAPGVRAARVDAWAGANAPAADNAAGLRGAASRGGGFGGRR